MKRLVSQRALADPCGVEGLVSHLDPYDRPHLEFVASPPFFFGSIVYVQRGAMLSSLNFLDFDNVLCRIGMPCFPEGVGWFSDLAYGFLRRETPYFTEGG